MISYYVLFIIDCIIFLVCFIGVYARTPIMHYLILIVLYFCMFLFESMRELVLNGI